MFLIVCLLGVFAVMLWIGNRVVTQDAIDSIQHEKLNNKENLK